MMHALFDVALLDSMLVQAALRALGLAAVVGAALFLFKVRNPHHQLAAWSAVLAGALAMPLLMMWLVVEVPVENIAVPAGKIAEPLVTATMPAFGPDGPALEAHVTPRVAEALETAEPFDWPGLVVALYMGVAGLLLLRLGVGLVLTARIRAGALRIDAPWAGETDIRVTDAIKAPVTIGSTILLPADFETWTGEKRDAVLLHERAHVTRGDFYVQGLAAIHRAVFWFSPLAWWLHDRLAELAEDASDAEAASQVPYRADYAAVLLDFARVSTPARLAGFKLAPLGVAMARPATVSRRIERVLAEKGLPAFVSRGARAWTACVVFTLACAAAITICKVPAQAAVGINVKPRHVAAPVPAATGEVCSEGEAAVRPISPLLPVMPARPISAAVSAPASAAPAHPAAPIVPISAIPPVEFDTHADGPSMPVDHPSHWKDPGVAADVDIDIDMEQIREQIRESLGAAGVKGPGFDKQLAARIEAAAARAEARAEAAAEHTRERQTQARERQFAAAEPSGPVVKETRNVDAFTGVSFGGAGKVFITVGPKVSVVLEADATTLGRTRTEVENGVLKIRARNDDSFFNGRGDITAYITVPELRQARVSGSGDLKVTGLAGGETELSVSGSGNVEASGKLKALDLDISGSGNAKMDALMVDEASVAISGSGSAVVDVREDLNVRVSGSGSVRYLTQPKDVSTSISGSGSVRRRDPT
ncbi:MAG: DUF2807 domain-containing protein [Proteobacteria bacterium]|nr:DUF2807 domain-containing protein [Pseudomonadota bacterium]